MKVIKNMTRMNVETHFRNKDIVIRSKASKSFDMGDEEQRAEYYHWIERYGFMRDITALIGGELK